MSFLHTNVTTIVHDCFASDCTACVKHRHCNSFHPSQDQCRAFVTLMTDGIGCVRRGERDEPGGTRVSGELPRATTTTTTTATSTRHFIAWVPRRGLCLSCGTNRSLKGLECSLAFSFTLRYVFVWSVGCGQVFKNKNGRFVLARTYPSVSVFRRKSHIFADNSVRWHLATNSFHHHVRLI